MTRELHRIEHFHHPGNALISFVATLRLLRSSACCLVLFLLIYPIGMLPRFIFVEADKSVNSIEMISFLPSSNLG